MKERKIKKKLTRLGDYWVDSELLKEGYGLGDIIEFSRLELPELIDPSKRIHVGWLICPECCEYTQIDRRNPTCTHCGWNEDEGFFPEPVKCAA
ncbi:MAG: hypothetical protein SGJ18_00915 [Pseudomonadota bacterium]|nr:hypothetical protein [Pseudomonadota bacterium]